MDPKYEYRYASNASAIARANSLTGRGTLKVMASHWGGLFYKGCF